MCISEAQSEERCLKVGGVRVLASGSKSSDAKE